MRCWEGAHFLSIGLDDPLLDLGCGDGTVLESLFDLGEYAARPLRVYGLDLDPGLAARAAARAVFKAGVAADARCQPFRSGVFGSVVAICVLEHIARAEAVLGEVRRILKNGGIFAFSVPTPHMLAVGAGMHSGDPGYVARFNERVQHQTVWSAETWQGALHSAGLEVEEVCGFMPPDAAEAWFAAYDWVVRPIPGRGRLFRLAGPNLRRLRLGRILASYWFRRLRPWAEAGVTANLNEACALIVVSRKP